MSNNTGVQKLAMVASGFYKLSIQSRQEAVHQAHKVDRDALTSGGLTLEGADSMVQNAIGIVGLPLGVLPCLRINDKEYTVPMCVEEPSVIAACNSAVTFIRCFSAQSTANIMVGQIHLPSAYQADAIVAAREPIIEMLNLYCVSMVRRGGGVMDLKVRPIGQAQAVCEVYVDVCDAMGANVVNTCCEMVKEYIGGMGIGTGIAILTNYCTERMAKGWFEVPVSSLNRKNVSGRVVAEKIIEAYGFAKRDKRRAVTHNKGIMNGIDAVCIATGQDWRAVEASSHAYASRTGSYSPLTHYQIVVKEGKEMFRGVLQLPLAVGCVGGALGKNPVYRSTMQMLGNIGAKELSEVLVCVGLAQNFAALRALAVEGIQNGHMRLHARPLALSEGVPQHLMDSVFAFMRERKSYTKETVRLFMDRHMLPKL